MRRDQKEKNKVKEVDAKRMGRDYQREERAKETGERQKKTNRMDEKKLGRGKKTPTEWTRRGRREETREIGGTQNLGPEKRLKLTGE